MDVKGARLCAPTKTVRDNRIICGTEQSSCPYEQCNPPERRKNHGYMDKYFLTNRAEQTAPKSVLSSTYDAKFQHNLCY